MNDKRLSSGSNSPLPICESGELHSIKRLTPEEITFKMRDGRKVLRNASRYIVGELLGEGSYGKVKEVLDAKSKKILAVKILTRRKLRNIPGGEESILREIEIMKKIHYKHCTQFVDYWTDDESEKSYLVLEYIGGGSLQDLLHRAPNKSLPLCQARHIFHQLLKALEYIHSIGIVHRDVKPDNIMLTTQCKLKLSDFGVARILSDDYSSPPTPRGEKSSSDSNHSSPDSTSTPKTSHPVRHSGSPAYQPPEVASGSTSFPGPTMDVWAAGVILYSMVFGRYPFEIDGNNVKVLFEHIAACEYTIPKSADPQLESLLRGILQPDPNKRLTVSQCKLHPFMTKKLKKQEFVPVQVPPSAFDCKNSSNSNCIIS